MKNLQNLLNDITFQKSDDSDEMRSNANVSGDTAMGKMLLYGTTVSKEIAKDKLINPKYIDKMNENVIYIHDLDFYPTGTLTCLQIPLGDMLKNGFSTGHGFLRPPKSIQSYASLACIALQANQNDMHGGQAFANFDYDMQLGVTYLFIKNIIEICLIKEYIQENEEKEMTKQMYDLIENDIIIHKAKILKTICPDITEKDIERALTKTEQNTFQAMESLVHNLCTMNSRAGSQVPFSSINFGLCTTIEGKMISKQLLLAQEKGLGHGETPIFPILIFKVKEGINYNEQDINYDLFALACRVSAKRMFPNFVFVDAPFNLQYYKEDDPETHIATMGCVDGEEVVTYLYENKKYIESFKCFYNRFTKTHKELIHPKYPQSKYIEVNNLKILDRGKFVDVFKIIKNPDQNNWVEVRLNNGRSLLATSNHPLPEKTKGRTIIKDLGIGDEIEIISQNQESLDYNNLSLNKEDAWALGLILCDGQFSSEFSVSLGLDEEDIANELKKYLENLNVIDSCSIQKRNRGIKGTYLEVIPSGQRKELREKMQTIFSGVLKSNRHIPNFIFNSNRTIRLAFLAGMIDADGHVKLVKNKPRIEIGSTNKELAIQQLYLFESVGIKAKMYLNKYSSKNNYRYKIECYLTPELNSYIISSKKINL